MHAAVASNSSSSAPRAASLSASKKFSVRVAPRALLIVLIGASSCAALADRSLFQNVLLHASPQGLAELVFPFIDDCL